MRQEKKHLKLMLVLLGVVFGMLLFAFALVPLYDTFCEMTGLKDKGGRVRAEIPTEIDTSRTITVKFITHVSSSSPLTFNAQQEIIHVHPGEVNRMVFNVDNASNENLTGIFTATVAPGMSAKYVKKTECFSFNRQPIEALEDKDMSVVFFIDKDLPDEIKELTLFYTLYDEKSGAKG